MLKALLLGAGLASGPAVDGPMSLEQAQMRGVMCFSTGERSDGMYKICYYDCLGDTVAITIGRVELCPLSIRN